MKNTMLFCFLVFSFSVQANLPIEIKPLGGVDVGNGGKIKVTGRSLPVFNSEKDLVDYVRLLNHRILSGKDLKIKEWIRLGNCSQEVSFKTLDVSAYYPVKNNLQISSKSFYGYMQTELNDCLTPELIFDDPKPPMPLLN